MRTVTPEDIADAFRTAGCRPGDTVLVQSDLTRIGPVAGARGRDGLLDGYTAGIRQAVGDGGTLAAVTASEGYARHRTPYHHETTPSEQGILSEHVRTLPGAVRSLHPLFSVAAVGPGAGALCEDAAPTGFGHDSAFERLRRLDGLIVCLGVDLLAMTFTHHIEQTFGVPYGYTKEWTVPVHRNGVVLERRFFAFVRYLDIGVEYDFTRFQERLLACGAAQRVPLGYGALTAVRAREAFRIGVEMLKDDVFSFLRTPPAREPWKGARMPGFD